MMVQEKIITINQQCSHILYCLWSPWQALAFILTKYNKLTITELVVSVLLKKLNKKNKTLYCISQAHKKNSIAFVKSWFCF